MLPTPSGELLPRPSPIPPHPDDVASAAKLVAAAERVVVFAGLGAVAAKAGPACRALAARTGSFAMGVAAARPDRTVVLFDGDGSLMMHIQELETIKRRGMNILIIVLNDGAYGSDVHKLRSEGMPEDGSVFGRPDFAAVAREFGRALHRWKSSRLFSEIQASKRVQ